MRTALGLLFAQSLALAAAAGEQAAPAPSQASQADVQAQQAKLANDMGNLYRSQYAPGTPAIQASPAGASPAEAQAQQAKVADAMGKYFRGQYAGAYAPPGGPSYGSGAVSGQGADVQAQQAKIASDMGKFYRSQYAPPGIEAQVQAQQAAMEAQQQAAAEAAKAAEAEKAKQSASGASPKETLLLASGPTGEEAATTTAPAVPRTAEDCQTMDQLKVWYDARLGTIKKYVPKDYNHFALDSLKREYDTNAKRIQEGPQSGSTSSGADGSADGGADVTRLGPVALDASQPKPQVNDQAPSGIDEAVDAFRKKVSDAQKKVQSKADDAADKATSGFGDLVDRFRDGVDSAAKKVQSKANRAADEADRLAKQAAEEAGQKAQRSAGSSTQAEQPETLVAMLSPATEQRSARVLHQATFALLLIGSGAFAGLWLKRRARASSEDLMAVYHMQP